MEHRLLILGLLLSAEMHGYQLHETIEAHLGHGIQLKRPTLYKLLKTLHDEALLSASEEPGERQQTRRVFTITEAGKAEFITLLKQQLADYSPVDFSDHVAIAYLDYLPVIEVIVLLKQRREKLVAVLEDVQALPTHPGSHQLFVDHQRHHLQAELSWLDTVIDHYQSQESE
jgi:DNA-binding PadR family transcriptional regulator